MEDSESDKLPDKMYQHKLWLRSVIDDIDMEVIPTSLLKAVVIETEDGKIAIDAEDLEGDIIVSDPYFLDTIISEYGGVSKVFYIINFEKFDDELNRRIDAMLRHII